MVKRKFKIKRNKQLQMGKNVEREHRKTVKYLQNYLEEHDRLPPQKRIYKHIAQDHLREFPKGYYTALNKMEKKLRRKHGR